MPEYTVISRRILTGTISDLAPAHRLAWIAILFEAEKLRGRVKLPIRDLAKMASIATADAAEALRIFQEPDPFSSSKELDGRRLLAIPDEEDWFTVVTWEKHAEERAAFFARLRQQRFRDRQAVTPSNAELRSVTKEPVLEPEPTEKPRQKTSPTKRRSASTVSFGEESPEMKAARYLFKKIQTNNPKAKEPKWQEWAASFDAIFRIDKREPEDVQKVIDISQAHSFWFKNILSPEALRKKFDRLLVDGMEKPRVQSAAHVQPRKDL